MIPPLCTPAEGLLTYCRYVSSDFPAIAFFCGNVYERRK